MKKENFRDRRFWLYIATVIYPNLIIITYSTSGIKGFLSDLFKTIRLYDPIVGNWFVFNMLLISSVLLVPALAYRYDKKNIQERSEFKVMVLQKLLFGINNIVETKRKRFLGYLNKCSNVTSIANTFLTITQPISQITSICTNLKHSFSSLCNDDTIKLSVIFCKDRNLENYYFHSDDEPTISITELNSNNSTAKQAVNTRKIILIPDVKKRTAKQSFWGDNSNIESVISYPVLCGSKVHFVVSLTSKNANTFEDSKRELYDFILETYTSRLLLEYYLIEIKKYHENEEAQEFRSVM